MMSVDMISVGTQLYARTMGAASDRFRQLSLRSARELNVQVACDHNRYSDHEAFEKVGIPSVWFERKRDPRYHTSRDRPEYVSQAHLQTMGRLVIHILMSLTEEDVERLTRETRP